ncbi:unnamed protein product [Strongylus vulgaris]|uniref:Uncharacterized protein n=1 Tax=Strongylus vulgaris TaxID=40348 RepID=A0A3P7IA11_STRVU|nr:unnamed protein product [Strongylus vulgaris]
MEWTKRERSRLVPIPLNDIFKVDLTQLKIDEKAAQANRKPSSDGVVRKKKLAGTEKSAKWPEERQLLSGSFKEPRLPVKPVSEMASPVPRTDSPSLLDPASISLI